MKRRQEKNRRKRQLKARAALRRQQPDVLKKMSQPPMNSTTALNLVILRDAGVMIDLPAHAHEDDKTYLSLRDKIMWGPRPNATYHEILFHNLNLTLGKEWIETQEQLPADTRHFIYEQFKQLDGFIKSGGINEQVDADGYKSSRPNGHVQALLTLAFDVYVLQYIGSLDEKVLHRLRQKVQYQGARYELTVAAIFARAGWTIKWLNDGLKGVKIPEFIATSPDGMRKVAVEAKSRHRPGVIDHPGIFDPNDAQRGQMLYLYKEALTKDTQNLPMIIFLDLNAPQNIAAKDKTHWRNDLIKMIDSAEPNRDEQTVDPYNLIISTNYAPHYDGQGVATGGQSVICKPTRTKYLLEDEYIWNAAGSYQKVPNLIAIS